MIDREVVITHLNDLRLFADVTVHPVVSPDNWNVYSSLCDYIDQIKTDVEILLKEQDAVNPMVGTDSGKVIKEFELFIKEFHPACTSEGVELDMLREVLALLKDHEDLGAELTNAVELIRKKNKRIEELLKEQEAVEPKKCWFLNNMNIPEEHWFCGKCNKELVGNGKYCANCGQAVKWNE